MEAATTHRCRTLLEWSAWISVELEYCFGIRLSCRRVSKRSDARMLPGACCLPHWRDLLADQMARWKAVWMMQTEASA